MKNRILIIGAGEAGRTILSEFLKKGRGDSIAGFIDDDINKIGKTVDGYSIFAGRDSLSDLISSLVITDVIIALPSAHRKIINDTVSTVLKLGLEVNIQILPSVTRYFNGSLLNELSAFSASDLLERDEFDINADVETIESVYSGKTILVTGAGGSIGSEICRQLLRFNIRGLICVGRGENSIYELAKSLNSYEQPESGIMYKICDVRNKVLLERIFAEYRPDIVIHAAAHKHVPLMELNEAEAFSNNIGGTNNLLELSVKFKVERFVLISTDKAVNPVNVMGATKRGAEILLSYYNRKFGLRASAVRFGNVLGSRGSVIPLFQEQIKRGGPVTVTHPDVTRFFMSIPEASLLVINAGAYAKGGEIFVLNMGEPYKIADIARSMIKLYGFEPDKDIKIEFTGLRPGEKLYEELFYDKNEIISTGNNKIYMLNNITNNSDYVAESVISLLPSVFELNNAEVREKLKMLVPEYSYDDVSNILSNRRIVS